METLLSQNNTVDTDTASPSIDLAKFLKEAKKLVAKASSTAESALSDGTACAELFMKFKETKHYKKFKQTFEGYINENIPGGYDLFTRYRKVVEVQRFLKANDLPPIKNEEQARIIAPRIKDGPKTVEDLKASLVEGELAPAKDLKTRLPAPKKVKKEGAVQAEKQQIDALQEQIISLNRIIAAQAEEITALKARVGLVAKKGRPRKKRTAAKTADENQTEFRISMDNDNGNLQAAGN